MPEVRGEPRWPMTLTVAFVIVLISLLPDRLTPLPMGCSLLATVLLIALVATRSREDH